MDLSITGFTAQKIKFSITDFFSKCNRICRKLPIWSHLLKKSLMENFTFCTVFRATLLFLFYHFSKTSYWYVRPPSYFPNEFLLGKIFKKKPILINFYFTVKDVRVLDFINSTHTKKWKRHHSFSDYFRGNRI